MSLNPIRLTRDVPRQTAIAVALAFAGLLAARQALPPLSYAPLQRPHTEPLALPLGPEVPPEAPAPDGRLAQEPGFAIDASPTGSLGPASPAL